MTWTFQTCTVTLWATCRQAADTELWEPRKGRLSEPQRGPKFFPEEQTGERARWVERAVDDSVQCTQMDTGFSRDSLDSTVPEFHRSFQLWRTRRPQGRAHILGRSNWSKTHQTLSYTWNHLPKCTCISLQHRLCVRPQIKTQCILVGQYHTKYLL